MKRFTVTPKESPRLPAERGSLALEQILIIAAIVTMSAGLFVFYDNISNYFRTFDLSELPTSVSTSSATSAGNSGSTQ